MTKAGFLALRESRVRVTSGLVAVKYAAAEETGVAYAISTKVGKAVVRNKLRRRSREILREAGLKPGYYLVSFRPEAAQLDFAELKVHLLKALSRIK